MIPRTFPSTFASNGQQQMVVYFLTSVAGLQRWTDYIPVKLTQGGSENTYNNNGYIDVTVVGRSATDIPFKDYVPVFVDAAATDAWQVNSTGFIPYNYAGFGDASLVLDFTSNDVLDPRITFTRSTTATYFNSAGVLTTTGFNLLTFSDGTVANLGVSGGVTNATSPISTSFTNSIQFSDNSVVRFAYKAFTTTALTVYTLSVYIRMDDNSIPSITANSALGDCCLVTENGVAASPVITNVGGNVYRATATFTATATGTNFGVVKYTTQSARGFRITGYQLEVGASATTYIPTQAAPSGAPRFDYNPTTLAPLGLLIEEQRTNLLLYSTDLSTGWSKGTAATWALNSGVAPDGTRTALGGDGVSGTSRVSTGSALYVSGPAITGGSIITLSVYVRAKTGTASNVCLRINETGGNNTVSPGNTVGTAWQRISLTVTTAVGATAAGVTIGTVTGTADLFIWGAQLEAGAFATSYIPTVASQVTRAADVAVMTGTNFSDWYNQTEGTVYVSSDYVLVTGGNYRFDITDGTTSNLIRLRSAPSGTTQSRFEVTTLSVAQTTLSPSTTNSTLNKDAVAYIFNSAAAVVNGGTVTVDTSITVPVVNQMAIGATRLGAGILSGHIQQIAYYPRRLSNAELQRITA